MGTCWKGSWDHSVVTPMFDVGRGSLVFTRTNENNRKCEQVHEHKWKWELLSCQHMHAWERGLCLSLCACVTANVWYTILFSSFFFSVSLQNCSAGLFLSLPDKALSLHLFFLSVGCLFSKCKATVETYIILQLNSQYVWNHTHVFLLQSIFQRVNTELNI